MKVAEPGDHVKLCYKGRLKEASQFDPAVSCRELEFEVGSGEVMPAFEDAIMGMAPQEKRTFSLNAGEAYGERDERLERTFSRLELPFDFKAGPGEMIALETSEGERILATVLAADEESVTLDLNHPLAGKELTFEVEVHDVQ